jgi:hypothetical protein
MSSGVYNAINIFPFYVEGCLGLLYWNSFQPVETAAGNEG